MSDLFLFDVDSTLINQEVIELIAAHAGVQEEVKRITDRAMAGELDFSESLKERVRLLSGLSESVLTDVYQDITLTQGAKELVSTLLSMGNHVGVVSGGFVEVIEPLMQELNISNYRANNFEIEDGKLTGRVAGQIIDRKYKALFLNELKEQTGAKRTFAIGDGANDIDMVQTADFGIAFCAKPALNDVADIVILKRDLREVLNYL